MGVGGSSGMPSSWSISMGISVLRVLALPLVVLPFETRLVVDAVFEVDPLVVRFSLMLTFFWVFAWGTFLPALLFFISAVVFLPFTTGGFVEASGFLLATVVGLVDVVVVIVGLVGGLVDLGLDADFGREEISRDFVVSRVVLDTAWCFAARRADERAGAAVLQVIAFLAHVTSELDLDVTTAVVLFGAGRGFETGDLRTVT